MKQQRPDSSWKDRIREAASKVWKPLSKVSKAPGSLRGVRMVSPLKSVGMKLFVIFFICIIVMVLALGLISGSQASTIIQNKVAKTSEQTLLLASQKVEDRLRWYEDIIMQAIMDKDISSKLSLYVDPNTDRYDKLTAYSDLSNKFMSMSSNHTEIRSITFLNTATGEALSTGGSVDNESLMKADWLPKVKERAGAALWLPTKQKGYLGESAIPTFAVARTIKDPSSGAELGVMIVEVNVTVLNDQLDKLTMGEHSPIVILSKENKLVRSDADTKIEKDFDGGSISDQEKINAMETAQSKTEHGNLIVYKQMELNGWTVVGSTPVKDLVKETSQIDKVMWILVAAAALVACVAGWFVARMIGKPLTSLRDLMQEGAQGTLTVRTKINRNDEIGQLASSFNLMMEQITKLVQQTTDSAAEVLETSGSLLVASKQTATSAKEIAVATEEIAGGASSLAVEAERGNVITSEISMQMQQVVTANEEMEHAAHEVQQVSERGTTYMADLSLKTGATEQMVRSMVDKVTKLKESTSSIRKVLEMLNNMTKQTNILSLNATIEAARAGTAGKGFMVVADEIRKLAEQSKQSIEVVGQITDSIQKEVDETVKALSDAYPVFQEQISAVKEAELIFTQVRSQMGGLSERLNGVSVSIERLEQSQETLTDAMANVSAVAEESSATSQEVASLSSEQMNVSQGLVKLSESLETLSNSLQEQLTKFKI